MHVTGSDQLISMAGHSPPEPVTVLRGHTSEVSAARFHPDGERLLTGDATGELRLWILATRRPVATLAGAHDGRVLGVHVDASGALAAQGRNGCVRVWESGLERGAPSLELRTGCFNFCRFDVLAARGEPARKWLVALPAFDGEDVVVWDLGSGTRAFELRRQSRGGADAPRVGMCTSVAFDGAGGPAPRLLAGLEDGSVALWDVRMPDGAYESTKPHDEPVLCLAARPSAGLALSGAADRRLCALSVRARAAGADAAAAPATDARGTGAGTGRAGGAGTAISVAHAFELPVTNDAFDTGGINDLAVRADGRLFASAGWDRRVRLFELGKKWRPLAVLRHHTGAVNAVDFSPCGTWLASASEDKTVALWSVYPPRKAMQASDAADDFAGSLLSAC